MLERVGEGDEVVFHAHESAGIANESDRCLDSFDIIAYSCDGHPGLTTAQVAHVEKCADCKRRVGVVGALLNRKPEPTSIFCPGCSAELDGAECSACGYNICTG